MKRPAFALVAMLAIASAPPDMSRAFDRGAMKPMSDAEMEDARGGFDWNGMAVSFGADIQTFVNGQLALRTLVNWTANGASTQTAVGPSFASAQAGLLAGGRAAALVTNGGQTAVIQSASSGLQNVLVNSAPNLQAIQQTTATLGLTNYSAFARGIQAGAIGTSLAHDAAVMPH